MKPEQRITQASRPSGWFADDDGREPAARSSSGASRSASTFGTAAFGRSAAALACSPAAPPAAFSACARELCELIPTINAAHSVNPSAAQALAGSALASIFITASFSNVTGTRRVP